MSELKLGLIGLDTSHCVAFAKLLNDEANEYFVPGGKIVAGFPGGSPDFALSVDRVEGFTNELRDDFGVSIEDSPLAVAEKSDAILLTSVDGRVHRALLDEIAPTGKPVFIDKPLATSSADAQAIAETAKRHGVRIMSCSSTRYGQPLVDALKASQDEIIGADFYGPMNIEETQGGLFWYGIHAVEMLYTTLGRGCREVRAYANADFDLVTGVWNDGRVGTVRGNRKGNWSYGGLIHRSTSVQNVDYSTSSKPLYAGMLESIMLMFKGGEPDIDLEDSLELVRFIEATNESRLSGLPVQL